MAPLTAEQRQHLLDSDFAVPEKRLLPIQDEEHARLAWDRLDSTHGLTPFERDEARSRIIRALHRLGVRLSARADGGRTLTDAREARITDETEHVIEVTIIRPGVSANGYVYSEPVLRASLDLWNGAAAFVDHPNAMDLTRAGGRSLRDLAGVYEKPRYDDGIKANLRLFGPGKEAFGTIQEAISARQAGRPAPPVGISADMRLLKTPARASAEGKARWAVQAITAVNSADLVFKPSAGGSFDRILEGQMEDPINSEEVSVESSPMTLPTAIAPAPDPAPDLRQSTLVDRLVRDATEPLRRQMAAAVLEARLANAGLPTPAAQAIRAQLADRAFEAAEVDAAIDGMRRMLGDIFGGSAIKGAGASAPYGSGARVVSTPLDRIQAAFDRLFGLELPPQLADVPRFTGIREAYIAVTGDRFFDGRYHWEESVVREANETTTSVMSNVVLNSMTKRLVQDYQAQPKWWEPFTIKVPVIDMKQQNRIRLNDFASLASVAEDGAYANVAWGDARENYTPTKYGNLVAVTLEMFLNDDLRAVQRIPTKLAHAAIVTINEFVAGLFTANAGAGPAMADTHDVFDAVNHQGNTSTLVSFDLSSAALQSAMTVLEKMQNTAGKRIGVRGRYLLIPPDLRWTAQVITQSAYATGTPNNDVNPLVGAVMPIVVPQLTTAYQWYLLADPSQIESIELGFLNGREEPELLVQDNPTSGAVFTNDAISYKVRHIYGGGWLDYRGAFAALPAS